MMGKDGCRFGSVMDMRVMDGCFSGWILEWQTTVLLGYIT